MYLIEVSQRALSPTSLGCARLNGTQNHFILDIPHEIEFLLCLKLDSDKKLDLFPIILLQITVYRTEYSCQSLKVDKKCPSFIISRPKSVAISNISLLKCITKMSHLLWMTEDCEIHRKGICIKWGIQTKSNIKVSALLRHWSHCESCDVSPEFEAKHLPLI